MILEYNPRLSAVSPTTRVAYAKFMRSKLRSDFAEKERKRKNSEISDFSLDDEVFEAPSKADPKKRTGEICHF